MRPNLSSLSKALERIEEIRGRFPSPAMPEKEPSSRSFARELDAARGASPSSSRIPPQQGGDAVEISPASVEERLRELQNAKERSSRTNASSLTSSWSEEILQASRESGVPPELLRAMMQMESGGNPRAVSPKGAMGLMQLMPGTARLMGVQDPYDPQENLRGGAAYMARMMQKYGDDQELALAAYNAGPGRVDSYGGIPPFPETQNYVKKVLSLYEGYLAEDEGR
jgi:soluble lytic murein transglycosylase-like protein